MALLLRRAVSSRSFFSVRDSIYHSRSISYISSSSFCKPSYQTSVSGANASSSHLGSEFLRETRRGFAKGKKSKEDAGGGSTLEAMPDVGPIAKATAKSLMEAAIDALSRELSKLRTGRASAGMLDHIIVDTGGVRMPLSRLAVISVIDSKTLSVTPYDPNSIKEVESAIVSSPLGLNPQLDGQRLIAPIPPLTKEHMQAICKVVTKSAEDVKQSIRRARQKALDTIKKAASSLSKDDVKRLEKEIDEMTKKFIKSADDMCKAKEKEISSS